MIEILSGFYIIHYNFGIIAILMLLFALWLGSRKNAKGAIAVLLIFIAYNLIIYNKTKLDPEWYDKAEEKVKSFDPVKEAWEERPADDDVNKRK